MIGLGGSLTSPLPGTPFIDEDGSTLANFTIAGSGTWSSNGTEIEIVGPAVPGSNLTGYAEHDTPVPPGEALRIAEADIYIPLPTGIMLAVGGVWARPGFGFVDQTDVMLGAETLPATINQDTWYTVRVVVFGSIRHIYLDGTYVGRFSRPVDAATTTVEFDFPATFALGWRVFWPTDTSVDPSMFRNVRVWTGTTANP